MKWVKPTEVNLPLGMYVDIAYGDGSYTTLEKILRNWRYVQVGQELTFQSPGNKSSRVELTKPPTWILPRHLPGETVDGQIFIPWEPGTKAKSVSEGDATYYELLVRIRGKLVRKTKCRKRNPWHIGINWMDCKGEPIPEPCIEYLVQMELPNACYRWF